MNPFVLRAIRAAAAAAVVTSFDPSGFTLLSELLPSLSAGQDLVLADGVKVLVDLQMTDDKPLGYVTGPGLLRFDPRVDTRLLVKGLDTNVASSGDLASGATHPTRILIHFWADAPTTNGYSAAERTALGIGSGIVRGYTHIGNTPTGNDGFKNDSGGVARGFLCSPGHAVKLFGQGPAVHRLNAHAASGATTLTIDPPLARALPTGTRILVCPTGFFDPSKRTEERTLAAPAAAGATTIVLNAALGYARWGRKQYATDRGISLTPDRFSNGSAARYTASISGTTMTVTSVDVPGSILVGQRVFDAATDAPINGSGDTFVEALGTGTGGVGTYTVGRSQNVASRSVIVKGMRTDDAQDPLIDQRAFIAVMTSNVVIDAYDLGNTALATLGFGWHGMSMGLTSITQLVGVLMRNGGQAGLLGRYGGWHFHQPSYNADGTIRTDGVAGSTAFSQTAAPAGPNYPPGAAVVKGCGFDIMYNRGAVLHACRGVVITDNVGYRSRGHTFFEEDGSEEDCVVERNLAIQAVPLAEGAALKLHETQGDTNYGSAGLWFGNPRNRHIDNWATDCEAHGWWNGFPTRDFNNNGTSGCTGFSANVPIYPQLVKINTSAYDVWDGNSALSCGQGGRTNMNPYDEQGRGSDAGYSPKDNERPDGANVTFTFKGIRFYKCGGGPLGREAYHNRVQNGRYLLARVADVAGPAFNGQAQWPSSNDYPIGIGYSLNAEPSPFGYTMFAASYHGIMKFRWGSFYNYGGDQPVRIGVNLIKCSCVIDSWDLYNDPLHGFSMNFTDWRMFASNGVYQTPAPSLLNDVTTYDGILGGHQPEDWAPTQHSRHMLGVIYDHEGRFSQGVHQSGTPHSHIVFNQPALTIGIANATPLEFNPFSVITTTPIFGINFQAVLLTPTAFNTLPLIGNWGIHKAETWRRLDASLNPIAGAVLACRDTYNPDQGTTSSVPYPADGRSHSFGSDRGDGTTYYPALWGGFFNGSKFGMVPSGGILQLEFAGAGDAANGKDVADYAFLTECTGRVWHVSDRVNTNANDLTDHCYASFPVKGTRTITTVYHAHVNYTPAASWAALQAAAPTDHKYWFDTANNRLIVKFSGETLDGDEINHDTYTNFSIATSA